MDHAKYLKTLANEHMQEGRRAIATKLLAAAWEIDRVAALERELAEARRVLAMVETECRADESQMVRDFVDSHVKPILEVAK